MAKNVQMSIKKWQDAMGRSADAMKAGVQQVTESPTAKAAAAVDKYARGTAEAVTSGRFVDGCNAVPVGEWKDAMINKGVPAMQNAVRNVSARSQRAQADAMEAMNRISDQVSTMPNTTEADADARMLAAVNAARQYGKNRRRS